MLLLHNLVLTLSDDTLQQLVDVISIVTNACIIASSNLALILALHQLLYVFENIWSSLLCLLLWLLVLVLESCTTARIAAKSLDKIKHARIIYSIILSGLLILWDINTALLSQYLLAEHFHELTLYLLHLDLLC